MLHPVARNLQSRGSAKPRVLVAMLISQTTNAAAPYTARAYFDHMVKEIFPDAHAMYRNGKRVLIVGWMPEYIRARGIADPWGQFFTDWLEVLEQENRVYRITTTET